jgi:hypothetical protein
MIYLLLVTVTSMVVAVIMGIIAWRIAGEEGRRREARIAALAADIHAAPTPVRWADAGVSHRAEIGRRTEPARLASEPAFVSATPAWQHDELELRPGAAVGSSPGLFAAAQPAPSESRWPVVLGIGTLAVGTAAALAILLSAGPRSVAHDKGTGPALAAAPLPAPVPLELVALGHERDGDRLTVRGVVRNPAGGTAIDGVTAVVFLFNRDGGFLASGRMPVQSTLPPGGETTFVVTVPGAGDVGRYRVSFRTDDRIVPHVDRRKLEVKS